MMLPYIRALLLFAALLCVVFAPPWAPLILIGILSLRFNAWEALFVGMTMDLVWLPGTFFYPLPLFTLASFLIVWGLEPLRRELFV